MNCLIKYDLKHTPYLIQPEVNSPVIRVSFMIAGPVVVQVLEGENAVLKNRELMGATNPAEAAPGTIRADFAQSIDENAVHGSDGQDTAQEEIAFFFAENELCDRIR